MIFVERMPEITSKWRRLWKPCSNPQCSVQTLRRIARRHNGIRLAEAWYCSADCFQNAAANRIREVCTSPVRPPSARKSRIPLGLLLHARGVLTKEQLGHALDSHRASGVNFGEAVQELGFATAEQVTAAVAAQWACPVFPLGDPPLAIPVRIPRRFLELHRMLPVHFLENGRKLLIGFVSGVQYQVLYTIEHMTECMVQPCFITARDYERNLHRCIETSEHEDELLFEQVISTAEIARITTNYVVQLGAVQARIGRCGNYIWARTSSEKREVDLLFRLPAN